MILRIGETARGGRLAGLPPPAYILGNGEEETGPFVARRQSLASLPEWSRLPRQPAESLAFRPASPDDSDADHPGETIPGQLL